MKLVVVGHGPTGHRLVEALRERDEAGAWQVTVIGEETRPAFDRVALTSYLTADADLACPAHDEGVTLLTGDPVDRRTAVEWGLASETVPEPELDTFALGLARRVAELPANQLHMMKLLVNQAFEQMGMHTTQLIGTLLDGSARHTPEGAEFTRAAMEDLGRTIAERDAPFGDYGQEKR